MKKIIFSLLIVALSIPFAMTLSSSTTQKKEPLRHVVVFKYKSSASEAQIKQVTDAFRDLQKKIPGITSFEHGINNSPENKNQGFTHVYLLTFEDAKFRDNYLPHPEHKKFGELLGKLAILNDAFVVDYEAKK